MYTYFPENGATAGPLFTDILSPNLAKTQSREIVFKMLYYSAIG